MGCNDSKPLPPFSAKDIARFWSHVDKRGPDECWPWKKGKKGRYGRFTVSRYGEKRHLFAHRVAFFLCQGYDPFPLLACHSCDSRYPIDDFTYGCCCNGAHLVAGTQAENQAHMAASGRGPLGDRNGNRLHPETRCCGERHWFSKLTEQDVASIRQRYAEGSVFQSVLAAEFGVHQQIISKIVRRDKWKHIP